MQQVFLYYNSGILAGRLTFEEGQREGVFVEMHSPLDGAPQPGVFVAPEDFQPAAMFQVWRHGHARPWVERQMEVAGQLYEAGATFERGAVYAHMQSAAPVDAVVCGGVLVGFMIPGRNESVTVVLPGYEDCTNLCLWHREGHSPAAYAAQTLPTEMVPMADGVRLATDVVLPQGPAGETYPALLVRTCYGKSRGCEAWYKYARRGYALVIQDTRGREMSEGEWLPFAHERQDGDDTLNWIASQPWSNGDVGMIGGSYLGYVQWAAAASGNPHLKVLVSQVTAGSPFVDLPRRGGAFGAGILAWSFMVADRETDFAAGTREDWDALLAHRPICEIPQKGLGRPIDFYDAWMAHADDGPFWQQCDFTRFADKIDVPALYISGWYDDDGPGTTQAWEMNQQRGRAHQKMIVGPWLHKTNSARRIHEMNLPANALRYDLDYIYLLWLDHFLKGMNNGVEQRPAVEYYCMGAGTWQTAAAWPPPQRSLLPFYLAGDGRQGSLQGAPPKAGAGSYVADPADPFPYIIDVSENECAIPGNYRLAEQRDDVLLYTSDPLEQPLAIAGDVWAYIWAASDAPDTDFVVRLTDVSPEGDSFRLSDGILRARYRKGFDAPQLLTPGKTEAYTLRLTRIAHTFLPGHRIRVQVTSGASKLCFANSQTGGDESRATQLRTAHQTVYSGGQQASAIFLPVLPAEK